MGCTFRQTPDGRPVILFGHVPDYNPYPGRQVRLKSAPERASEAPASISVCLATGLSGPAAGLSSLAREVLAGLEEGAHDRKALAWPCAADSYRHEGWPPAPLSRSRTAKRPLGATQVLSASLRKICRIGLSGSIIRSQDHAREEPPAPSVESRTDRATATSS